MSWYLKVLKKYKRFHGRARRKEYWYFILFNWIILMLLVLIESLIMPDAEMGILATIYMLAIFIPGLGVTIRRLHDTGKTSWWILINFIPLIGPLIFLFFMIQDSQPGRNRFGRNPKEKLE
ncbi:MAG: DUF805 domain-containing protein [Pleurocapsa sp.]